MTTALAEIDAPPELKDHVSACVQWSKSNEIATAGDYAETGEHLKEIKTALKRADEFFDPPIKSAFELHRMLCQRKRVLTDPLKQSEQIDKQKMKAFADEQQAKADAERRRLQAIADEQARREREALERRAAAAKKPETVQRLQEEAASIVAPVVAVASVAPKVAGVSTRTTWKATVTDQAALIAYAIANNRADLLIPNLAVLDALAKGLKEAASIPGVQFAPVTTMSARG